MIYSILLSLFLHQSFNFDILLANIKSIVNYFEETEQLHHNEIRLVSSLSAIEAEKLVDYLSAVFPRIKINYSPLESRVKGLCTENSNELVIFVPSKVFTTTPDKLKYRFQSGKKNIFGSFSVDISYGDSDYKIRNEEFFITSISENN